MNKIGLACEGITDFITLENILCGYFEDPDLDEDIIQLQPHLDETGQKQAAFGGWEMLIDYLQSTRFREDVLNVETVVVQLDTDIIEHVNFGDSYRDTAGEDLTVKALIEQTIDTLTVKINLGEALFYDTHQAKIRFAICVHSLECWLYAYYNTRTLKKPKVTSCGKALNHFLEESGFDKPKEPRVYRDYSAVFLKKKNIDKVTEKDASFSYFIQQVARMKLS